jgi:phage tail-like protein
MPTTTRRDPLHNFQFRARFSNSTTPILGVSKITGMKRTTEVAKHRSGGDPSTSFKLPMRTDYDPIVLERGVVLNATEFEAWANKVFSYVNAPSGQETSLADFRRDLVIDVYDETGQKAVSYQVFNCWVSEYQPIADLDANSNAVLVQHIRIEHEGWVRDTSAPLPKAVSFNDPAS